MVMCRAHGSYAEAMKKGDDGRPDFEARKACNYLEDAIEVNDGWRFTVWCKGVFSQNRLCNNFLQNCSSHLTDHECNSEEEVDN